MNRQHGAHAGTGPPRRSCPSSASGSAPAWRRRPAPRAMIKGTVMGPVVTPPASKATASMFRGMKKLRRNTAVYRTRSTHRRGTFHTVRRTDTTRNSPTPAATVQMSTGFGIPGTWVASTVRSGSATVTRTPTRKNTAAIRDTRLLQGPASPAQGFPHRHHGHIRTQGEQSHPHHQEHRPGQKQQQGLQGYWRCRHSQEQNDQTDRQHAGQGLVGLFLQRFVDDDNPSLFSVFAI